MCGINLLITDDIGNKSFLDKSNGKRPIDVELSDAYLASDGSPVESPLVTRKLKPGEWSPSQILFVHPKIINHFLQVLQINQRARGSPCPCGTYSM